VTTRRILLVNADDFGFTTDVNEGIVHCHREGILTATTLMANAAAFDHAVRLAKRTPTLDVGCHGVLVSGHSLATGRELPNSLSELIPRLILRQIDPYAELKAQFERIRAAGLRITHIDTHKHTHLLPSVLDAVARLAAEHGIGWVRRPFDLPINGEPVPLGRRLVSRGLGFLRRRFHRVLSRHGCATTDHFAGFSLTGYLQASDLIRLFEHLPGGSTELMVHPGFHGEALERARTRLKAARQKELEALTDPEVKARLRAIGIQLGRYSAMSGA
jgi:predicted glycoside hydrolase/deacetylase ChbG (UPF0249 family)